LCIFVITFLSKNLVHPSFSQKCSHVAFVTRLPDQLCAASWATTSANDRSPASSVGVTNVRHGFLCDENGSGENEHIICMMIRQ
jgi:hypothetical protein